MQFSLCSSFPAFLTMVNSLSVVLFIYLFLSLWHPEISEDEAEDRLQDAIQEKFAVFGDVSTCGK